MHAVQDNLPPHLFRLLRARIPRQLEGLGVGESEHDRPKLREERALSRDCFQLPSPEMRVGRRKLQCET